MLKLFVFAPDNEKIIKDIINAGALAGAGVIGDYTHCAFVNKGKGSWWAQKDANPTTGGKDKMEYVDHVKIEMICPEKDAKLVEKAIRKVHPYEKVGIDFIKLESVN